MDSDRAVIAYRDTEPGPAQPNDRRSPRTILSDDSFTQANAFRSDVGSSCAAGLQVWPEKRLAYRPARNRHGFVAGSFTRRLAEMVHAAKDQRNDRPHRNLARHGTRQALKRY